MHSTVKAFRVYCQRKYKTVPFKVQYGGTLLYHYTTKHKEAFSLRQD